MSNWPTVFEPTDSGAIDSFDVGELLASLTDKSLVVLDDATGRYRLLETVRDYARILLASAHEVDEMRSSHRDFFLALAEEAEPQLTGSEQAKWLERVEREHENLHASLVWSQGDETPEAGLRLCGALARFWWTRGFLTYGREWCERALGKAGTELQTKERADTLNGAGNLAYCQGAYDSARVYHEECLSIRRETSDRRGIAASLTNLGSLSHIQGNDASARIYHEESLFTWREIGDRWGIAASLNNLGSVAYDQGDSNAARAYLEESLKIKREIGDRLG